MFAESSHQASGCNIPVSGESRETQGVVSTITWQPGACPNDGIETPDSHTILKLLESSQNGLESLGSLHYESSNQGEDVSPKASVHILQGFKLLHMLSWTVLDITPSRTLHSRYLILRGN